MPRKHFPPQDPAIASHRSHALKLLHNHENAALSAFLSSLSSSFSPKRLIDAPDPNGDTLVHFAARMHNLATLRLLVQEYGGNPRAVNEHGRQPIHEAIDSVESVQLLVEECRVEVDAIKRGDWTPLMIAGVIPYRHTIPIGSAMKGNLKVMKILVNAGANVEMVNKDGWNALHLAAKEGHLDATIYLTTCSPISTLRPSTSGRLPIHTATICLPPTSPPDLILYLLTHSPSTPTAILRHTDNAGLDLFSTAIHGGNLSLIRTLVRTYGADPNRRDRTGRQPAHHGAMTGQVGALREVWEATGGMGFEVDSVDAWDEWTPLMHAAKEGWEVMVRWLVEVGGAKVGRKDNKGRRAVDLVTLK
ncbi:ankyrin repeat-containing domain protein [Endogone sp. FLAS-F59071]|nr:ankyrin repeat-containing domain protein [Endogone sp. FLAS-F59071]|eukprot:RUS21933.1 ankyrin repeat-containing domain protein [Endogone sp. FLAS-F59071]